MNLEVITASYTKVEIGVEVSTTEDFKEKKRTKATDVIGRKFSVRSSVLEPNTKYYYRTYVNVSSLSYDYYGETYSFTTKELTEGFAVTGSVEELGAFFAQVAGKVNLSDVEAAGGSAVVGIELSENTDFSSPTRLKSEIDDSGLLSCRFALLTPGTKYYYRTYVTVASLAHDFCGETKSFETQKLSASFVTTGDVEDVGLESARLSGSVDLSEIEGEGATTTVGIEISTNSEFSSPQRLTTNETSGSFSLRFNNLKYGTQYYYRAFVDVKKDSNQTTFNGSTKTFVTTPLDNSNHYVDLGLPSGTLWATMNVGASKPEDYGDYFAWGETTTKSTYDWSTYKWCNGDYNNLTKYCNDSNYGNNGFTDNLTELDLEDDAAYVNWGSNWRMPSKAQFDELINSSYTTTEWTTVNGVNGRLITSKTNGNSIFLPAAGCRNGTSLHCAGSFGYYWSRTLYAGRPADARGLYFDSSSIGTSGDNRGGGQSVRPVRLSE